MIGPHALHQRCAKRPRGIHARSRQANRAQMAQRHRQADCQRSNEPMVRFVLVANSKHAENQQKTEEELNAQTLCWQHTVGQLRVSDVGKLLGK